MILDKYITGLLTTTSRKQIFINVFFINIKMIQIYINYNF